MAKKGREARIMRTITKIRGEKLSAALQKRALARPMDDDAKPKSLWKKRKERAKIRAEARGTAEAPHGYHGGARVLLVGDGNLSFGLALATLFGNDASGLVVTCKEPEHVAKKVYPSCSDNAETLEACGATVVFGVECEALAGAAAELQRSVGGAFDRVVFNFPDAGVGKVGALSVGVQRALIASFFEQGPRLLKQNGELHLATQTFAPCAAWNVEGLAAKAGLVFKACVEFDPSEFPGYEYCHTPGEDETEEMVPREEDITAGECATYVFVKQQR